MPVLFNIQLVIKPGQYTDVRVVEFVKYSITLKYLGKKEAGAIPLKANTNKKFQYCNMYSQLHANKLAFH